MEPLLSSSLLFYFENAVLNYTELDLTLQVCVCNHFSFPMDYQKRVLCPENEELALYMCKKRQEMNDAKGITENIDKTLYKSYSNVCNSKVPIKTLKEFSQIKGVGKWTLRLMQGFFHMDSGSSEPEPEDVTQKGKKTKGKRRYVPQKNSVAYALLITLYRAMTNGNEFMRKQELIDAAETSGLSRVPIVPEKGRGKLSGFASSPKEWYSGWSCMTTLITKGLVVKSSCPAKYMLTQEGREAAHECLSRSGLVEELRSQDVHSALDLGSDRANLARKESSHPKDQTYASIDHSESSQKKKKKKKTSSLGTTIVCQPKKDEICTSNLEPKRDLVENYFATSSTNIFTDSGEVNFVTRERNQMKFSYGDAQCGPGSSCSADFAMSSYNLKACSSYGYNLRRSNSDGSEANLNALAMPPLGFGERFEEVYDVILIVDDREQFTRKGSTYNRIIENIRAQFKIQVEVRRLPVGDGIWIARNRCLNSEYVLDFVVERKDVDDLRSSIRDNRYRDQKLRLLRCGLKKLIYLVEGDPNSCEAAESIKTACFTTEILEGFDVQRTSGLADTVKRYAHLTLAITHYYRTQFSVDKVRSAGNCPSYDEFIKKCEDLDKMTVSDVFAMQLMQVPLVTEEVAVAVLDLYPTLLSLAQAYSLLDGDINAQEDMLRKQSNNLIGASSSRNIFQLVWGG